jgi:hypothetical protein
VDGLNVVAKKMDYDEAAKPKRMHFALTLLLSFLAFPVGCTIDQTFRWTNHWDGFVSGLIQGGILGVLWCLIYVLPWSLIIFWLYRWRRWQKFRTPWILAPSILIVTVMIGSLIVDPPTPAKRFKNFAKTELPSNAQNLKFRFSGGGFADYADTYYFKTTPEEVDRIIADMGLAEDEFYGREGFSHTTVSQLDGCPDFSSWEGAKQFKGWDDRQHWFYYLITDSTRTQVYVMVGCI